MWPWHKACESRALELSPTFCSILLKGIEGSECVCGSLTPNSHLVDWVEQILPLGGNVSLPRFERRERGGDGCPKEHQDFTREPRSGFSQADSSLYLEDDACQQGCFPSTLETPPARPVWVLFIPLIDEDRPWGF